MKKLLFAAFLFISFLNSSAQSNTENIANKIAKRMKDTLELSDTQEQKIYQINLQLAQQKLSLRSQFTNHDSLRVHTQLVEKTRDVLYSSILTGGQFDLYRQKKTSLVNNNN